MNDHTGCRQYERKMTETVDASFHPFQTSDSRLPLPTLKNQFSNLKRQYSNL